MNFTMCPVFREAMFIDRIFSSLQSVIWLHEIVEQMQLYNKKFNLFYRC